MEQIRIFSTKSRDVRQAAEEIEDEVNEFLDMLPQLNGEMIDIKTSVTTDAETMETIMVATVVYELYEEESTVEDADEDGAEIEESGAGCSCCGEECESPEDEPAD